MGTLLAPLAGLVAPVAAAAERAAPVADTPPLTVDIETLSPHVLTPKGPLTITGTISNDSDDVWTSVNLQPLTSSTPITTSVALREAAALPADALIGERITATGSFETIDELAPGESQWFSITVDREHLGIGSTPGVYWVGVHARGTNSQGHDDITDGRDRMFLPLVTEPARRAVPTTVVVPVRAKVSRDAAGHLTDLDRWRNLLERGGRLHDLFQVQAGSAPTRVTWLLDPAVLEAVEQIARGNPADPLMTRGDGNDGDPDQAASPSSDGSGSGSPSGEPTPAPSTSPSATPSSVPLPGPETPTEVKVDPELQQLASVWLSRSTAILREAEVLALPYGDVDVSGATAAGSDLAQQAAVRSATVLKRLAINATAAVNSVNGHLRPAALKSLTPGTRALVERDQVQPAAADQTLPETTDQDTDQLSGTKQSGTGQSGADVATTSQLAVEDHQVTVYETFDDEPNLAQDAASLRQRLLAEATVRREEGIGSPLVVKLPNAWHPSSVGGLGSDLDHQWLTWQSLADSALSPSASVPVTALTYPRAMAAQEVPGSAFAAARSTVLSARQLAGIIDGNSPLGPLTERAVFTTLSQQQRDRAVADAELDARRTMLSELRGSVTIQAPKRVLLSSASGQFPGTVANDLDVPVTVKVRATTDDTLALSDPGALEVPARGRVTVRFEAESAELGMHQVALAVTDADGDPLGSSVELPLRAASVSVIVWWAMAAGAGVLVLMILRQWRRRGLRRRADPLPAPRAEEPVDPDPTPTDEAGQR